VLRKESIEMDCYYVTGASRGLGRALVERILAAPDTKVIGVARTPGPSDPHYSHRLVDLTQPEQVQAFEFDAHDGAERAILVNNAGLIKVGQVGSIDPADLTAIHLANAVAPAILTNAFLKACRGSSLRQAVVCNLTSRGGSLPIPGGAAYCSAKAALEMFTRVAAREAELSSDTRLRFMIANPGEVDTEMQSYLAAANETDFPFAEMVRKRKADGLLMSPELVADRLFKVLRDPDLVSDIRFDVQELAT
jgi:benzil reductase ((S)-benzoin forming)